ncbi:MAG: hypothetical protein R3E34_12875 [Rhodocyclaceae bacterium]
MGELSPGLLEAGVRGALLDRLQVARWPVMCASARPRRRNSAAVSCLLVGSGAGGMPVSASVDAILRGAVSASAALVEQGLENRVVIDAVEFIEIFEDVAISAAEGSEACLHDGDLAARCAGRAATSRPARPPPPELRCDEQPDW